ncbi:MAG TPA: aspartate kinase [Syntrophomonadaceae bacterium]|nr:aspartate kinase [Syntrophomonadaceae bacterium]
MNITVQKFGGTSLATSDTRTQVCEIIKRTLNDNKHVVIVVSAIGKENNPYATDTLINLGKSINPQMPLRELDFLMACGETISGVLLTGQLNAIGLNAQFLSGGQAGIVTDENHGDAHIIYINNQNIIALLEKGITPVVAGFQGISENGELTTLGRGGSDTTACALGVALGAEVVDIYTDVEGVMTADPRIVDNARLLNDISYNEICQMAREGAKIVHPRAIEIAMRGSIPLRIKSTFANSDGTLVSNYVSGPNNIKAITDTLITGITQTSDIAQFKIRLSSNKDINYCELKVFRSLAFAGISVDFINVQPETILFTVSSDATLKTVEVLEAVDIFPDIEFNCAKVAVVGAAMTGTPGVMARVVEALSEKDIPILQSGDSYTNIWCLVKAENMTLAVKALHDKFELGK